MTEKQFLQLEIDLSLRRDTEIIKQQGLAAIAQAESYYLKASCGRTVRSAPESFLQVEIFRSLVGHFPRITLEERTGQVLRDLQVSDQAITGAIRNGRIDILAWIERADGSYVPRYPIEIKNISGRYDLLNDVNRLIHFRTVSPRGKKICRAFIFACCVRSSSASVESLLTGVKFPDRATRPRVQMGKSVCTTRRNGSSAWFGCACYYF